MMFSVIIPTCHRNDLLAKCLDCLNPEVQTIHQSVYEVIVTDDGSQSTAKEMLEQQYPWVKWIQGPRKGPAANRNNGAKHAKGEWLIFTDDDCLPDANWVESYGNVIAQDSMTMVFEGRTYADREQRRMDEQAPLNETGGCLWSCNFAIHKSLFFQIGAFDENFPYPAMEDVDFHFRLKEANYVCSFVKEASICHPWRKTGDWEYFRQIEKSILYYLNKHPSEKKRLNKKYYIKTFLVMLVKIHIPDLLKYRFRGVNTALRKQFFLLRMALFT